MPLSVVQVGGTRNISASTNAIATAAANNGHNLR
jgi:hypothetical protein